MPPKERKERSTNFRTWETQSRLLSALVASLDNPRLDYKRIAKYYGGTATESAIEHRFRTVKVQADLIKGLVRHGEDPELYKVYEIKTKEEIQKFFGASTPDGLGFQFRSINKGANVLKQAVANGEDPVDAFAAQLKGGPSAAGSLPATPSHQRTPASTKRTRSVKSTGAGAKRQKMIKPDPDLESDDDVDSPEADYSELDTTPTKLKPKVLSTPRKNPELPPRSAWTKPVENAVTRPSPVPIAPAPSRPAAAAYTLAPIPGLGSGAPANGYTHPATGVGYNCAPPVNMTSANPSAGHSAAVGMTGTRRDSVFSTDSYTAGSSPATPTMSFSAPAPTNGGNRTMNNTGMGMNNTGVARNNTGLGANATATGTANNMGMPANTMASFNMTMFETTTSPTASTSDAHTPQTTTSFNAMAGSAANATATSFKTEEFTPFGGFGDAGANNSIGYSANNANADDQASYSFDPNEAAYAAEVDFGGFEGDDAWDDAGDC